MSLGNQEELAGLALRTGVDQKHRKWRATTKLNKITPIVLLLVQIRVADPTGLDLELNLILGHRQRPIAPVDQLAVGLHDGKGLDLGLLLELIGNDVGSGHS